MLNVTELARGCGLSRSTVLYYESIGLLKPAARTAARYRRYSEREAERLRQICVYRDAGLKLADIRALLDRPAVGDAAAVLQRRLAEIGSEIERLRGHQRSILSLLRNKARFRRREMMTKEKWVSIMRASGFTEADMHRWHAEFEKAAPEDHQEFLVYLKIPAEEVTKIREWSRTSA
jgi:MerR family transcriptional regulator, thiopeptide resistance regulator